MALFNQIFYRPVFLTSSHPSYNTSLKPSFKPKYLTIKLKMCSSQSVSTISTSSSSSKEVESINTFNTLLAPSHNEKIQQVESIKAFDNFLVSSHNGKIQQVESIKAFDKLLTSSHNKLVLVAFTPNHDYYRTKILNFMKELRKTCDARHFYIVADGSKNSQELCEREKFNGKVPKFCFYKGMQKIHQLEGLKFDQITCDVPYYSKNHDTIVQLNSKDEFGKLIRDSMSDNRLFVVLIGLTHCGPCARAYPTLLQLSKYMNSKAVFARMDGDANDSCKEFSRNMDVVEVPTFLFVKNGQICGRYVGSNNSSIIKEVAKYTENLSHVY